MKKLKVWLTGLLIVQLLLAVVLIWNTQLEAQKNRPKPLLNLDWDMVDKLSIEDKHNSVILVKKDGQWLTEINQLPANNNEAVSLINGLKRLQTSWPVATNTSSHKRFHVSPDKFIRHVQVFTNGELAGELFFGNSAGLRQTHARRIDDNNVYDVEMDTADIYANPTRWFDNSLLATSDISAIKGPDYNLKRRGNFWQFNQTGPSILMGNAGHGKVDQDSVNTFVQTFSQLTVSGVATEEPDMKQSNIEKITIDLTDDDNSWSYLFVRAQGVHYVKRNDRPTFFLMSKENYEKVSTIRQADLKPKSTSLPGTLLNNSTEQ